MARFIGPLARRLKYGKDVVVVSGLPRSGTSMMMRMLEAGGLDILTDNERTADEDNPKGYWELERVKRLEEDNDKSWLRDARGRGIKVISHLLKELPGDCFYSVVFMLRNIEEVVASQNKMLERRGEDQAVEDAKAIELYRKHLAFTKAMLRTRRNFSALEVNYSDAIADPKAAARSVGRFLGGRVDAEAMHGAVDASLYRNRRA